MNAFQAVNTIYKNTNNYELHFHRLEHYSLKNFSTALYRLEKAIRLNELSDEFILNDVITCFRKYRFYVVASLIPFNNHSTFLDKGKLDLLYNRCLLLFPNILDELESCYLAFEGLIKSDENPVLTYIEENIDSRVNTGVLLKATIDYDGTKQLLEKITNNPQSKLIGPQALKTYTFFDQLVVIGPTRWFPSYIFNSPHASRIHIITYKWLEQKFIEYPYLQGEMNKSTIFSGRDVAYHDQFFQKDDKVEVIIDTNIEKTVNYYQMERKLIDEKQTNINSEDDIVSARLVVLSGNKGILFEDVSLKNIFSIQSDSDGFTVGNISFNEIELNSYILIRTGTKQDLIRSKADDIIGMDAYVYRNINSLWKKRLKKMVYRNGIGHVQAALKKLGVKNPIEQNIRNWMSEDNIKPGSDTDFKAILKFVKLEEKETKYIKGAKLLLDSHRQAGNLIRSKLIEEIKSTDLSVLELKGEHVFNLSGEKGVSFTAYRVDYISEKIYRVQSSDLKEVILLR